MTADGCGNRGLEKGGFDANRRPPRLQEASMTVGHRTNRQQAFPPTRENSDSGGESGRVVRYPIWGCS